MMKYTKQGAMRTQLNESNEVRGRNMPKHKFFSLFTVLQLENGVLFGGKNKQTQISKNTKEIKSSNTINKTQLTTWSYQKCTPDIVGL
jgi:hypothetical protein